MRDVLRSTLINELKIEYDLYKINLLAFWEKIKKEFPIGIEVNWFVSRTHIGLTEKYCQSGIVKGYSVDYQDDFRLNVVNDKTGKIVQVSVFGMFK